MKPIKCIDLIAVITFIISVAICVVIGQMTAPVGTPPTIVIICTAITLIDGFWFMLRGLSLAIDEIISNK